MGNRFVKSVVFLGSKQALINASNNMEPVVKFNDKYLDTLGTTNIIKELEINEIKLTLSIYMANISHRIYNLAQPKGRNKIKLICANRSAIVLLVDNSMNEDFLNNFLKFLLTEARGDETPLHIYVGNESMLKLIEKYAKKTKNVWVYITSDIKLIDLV